MTEEHQDVKRSLLPHVGEDSIEEVMEVYIKYQADMHAHIDEVINKLDLGEITIADYGKELNAAINRFVKPLIKVMGVDAYEAWSGIPSDIEVKLVPDPFGE